MSIPAKATEFAIDDGKSLMADWCADMSTLDARLPAPCSIEFLRSKARRSADPQNRVIERPGLTEAGSTVDGRFGTGSDFRR